MLSPGLPGMQALDAPVTTNLAVSMLLGDSVIMALLLSQWGSISPQELA